MAVHGAVQTETAELEGAAQCASTKTQANSNRFEFQGGTSRAVGAVNLIFSRRYGARSILW